MSGSGCGNRRRTRCSRLFAGWLAYCVRVSRADLVIVDGPLRGRRIDAVPFAFGAQSFTVRAPLIISNYEHWVYKGGACAYVGPSIRGAIVIHRDPNIGVCSYERHAVVAAEAGALAWCKLYPALAETDFIPGFQSKSWTYGDERNIEPMVAVSVTQKAALALLDDIARVAEPVHAELTPSASKWEKLWISPWYALWQAVITLQALAVVELALCRLHAYVRMEAGLHVTIPNAICVLELSLNAARAFYFAVDPHFSKGILSFHATTVLHTVSMPVATVTTALFFIFFELATESAGMTTSVLRGRQRQIGIVAFAVLMVLSDLAISLSFHWAYEPTVDTIYVVLSPGVMPAVSAVLAIVLATRARKGLKELPAPIVRRLIHTVDATAVLSLCSAACGCLVLWAFWGPWRSYVVVGLHFTFLCALSYVQVNALRPIGVAVVRGPLRRLYEAVRHAQSALGGALSSQPKLFSRSTSALSSQADWRGLRSTASRDHDAPYGHHAAMPGAAAPAQVANANSVAPNHTNRLRLGLSYAWLERFARERLGLAHDECSTEAGARLRHALLSAPGSGPASPPDHVARALERGLSVCEALAEEADSYGRPIVSSATVFVSHAQSCSFAKLLDAVGAHVRMHRLNPESVFLWLDLFSIRQGQVATDVRAIGRVIRGIGRVLVVMDPWLQPVCLTRAWCLYEIAQAQLSDSVTLSLALAQEEQAEFALVLARDRKRVEQALVSFDARAAQASQPRDLAMIRTLIRRHFATGRSHDESEERSANVGASRDKGPPSGRASVAAGSQERSPTLQWRHSRGPPAPSAAARSRAPGSPLPEANDGSASPAAAERASGQLSRREEPQRDSNRPQAAEPQRDSNRPQAAEPQRDSHGVHAAEPQRPAVAGAQPQPQPQPPGGQAVQAAASGQRTSAERAAEEVTTGAEAVQERGANDAHGGNGMRPQSAQEWEVGAAADSRSEPPDQPQPGMSDTQLGGSPNKAGQGDSPGQAESLLPTPPPVVISASSASAFTCLDFSERGGGNGSDDDSSLDDGIEHFNEKVRDAVRSALSAYSWWLGFDEAPARRQSTVGRRSTGLSASGPVALRFGSREHAAAPLDNTSSSRTSHSSGGAASSARASPSRKKRAQSVVAGYGRIAPAVHKHPPAAAAPAVPLRRQASSH